MALFSKDELTRANAIAGLNYANPFLAERIELVRKILGDESVHRGDVWSEKPGQNTLGDLPKLRKATSQLAEAAVSRVHSKVTIDDKELAAYEGLIVYYLFDKHRENVSQLVRPSSESQPDLKAFYQELAGDVQRCLKLPGDRKLPSDYQAPHLFAMFFQIQRAFVHIFDFLIGSSMASAKLRASIWQSIFTHNIHRYQRSLFNQMGNVTTLITGPSGTGKELVARAVAFSRHIPFSTRKMAFAEDFRKQFFPLHLSAMPSNLIESELFGHRKGAYTGALEDRIGWLEEASEHGTVFLDEIGEVNEEIQVKLLRLIQNRTFQRLGETTEREFRGKIIAATNRNLPAAIQTGRFRADLFYRLCADQIVTPSLQEQLSGSKGELRDFVQHLATRIIGENEASAIARETTEWIIKNLGINYEWPGNVRELEQCIRNIMIRGTYQPAEYSASHHDDSLAVQVEAGTLTADELLTRYCSMIFRQTGSYAETARRLELDRRTVKSKVREDCGE